MTKTIYIAAAETLSNKRVVAIGVIDTLQAQRCRVGIFRPLLRSREHDALAEALLEICHLDQTLPDVMGATYDEIADNPDQVMTSLVAKMGGLRERYDAVVVIGSNFDDVSAPVEVSLNARIAANLDTPVVVLVSGRDKTASQVVRSAQYAVHEFQGAHNTVLGVVASRIDPDLVQDVKTRLDIFGGLFTAALPEDPVLAAPTVREQFKALGATVWKGSEEALDRESLHVAISGMTLPNLLHRIDDDTTLIMASDRVDLLPGVMLSQTADGFPRLSAIVLVGGYSLPDTITQMIDHLPCDFAIGIVPGDTYATANILASVQGTPTVTPRKVTTARAMLAEYANTPALVARLDQPLRSIRTQHRFEYDVAQQAMADKMTIVLPESHDPRILEAAMITAHRGVANVILLGEPVDVKAKAAGLGFDLAGIDVISMDDTTRIERYAAKYAEIRQAKGVTIEQAREKMTDPSYFGTMMVYLGEANAMVSGATHTTANTIRPAFEVIKTKPGVSIVSGAFFMCLSDRVLYFADCAVNPSPTPSQLADIAISSAESAAAFGIEPRIAMLSYSTGTSGAGPAVDAMAEATDLVRERRPDLPVDGPLQFDAAFDPVVGAVKMPGSPVAGQATVFIFPDLNSGNIAYKAVQRTAGVVAVGPVLQGLNKTVTDLSRGALVEDIVSTIAITAVQAQADKV